ncbi:MAG TPA: fibronectin type III domain-containing protein [Oscillatoriaceae cyanobacterium]
MIKRLNTTLIGGAIGLFLVGCSFLNLEHPINNEPIPQQPVAGVMPGVNSVTVQQLSDSQATLHWQSPWKGKTEVYYAKTPLVLPLVADKCPVTYEPFTTLSNLEPGTRYYFQVETQTPLGATRSAVLSFLTATPEPTPSLAPEVPHAAPAVPMLRLPTGPVHRHFRFRLAHRSWHLRFRHHRG